MLSLYHILRWTATPCARRGECVIIKIYALSECKKFNFFEKPLDTHETPHILDCRLPIADCRLPIADCRLPIADCPGRTAHSADGIARKSQNTQRFLNKSLCRSLRCSSRRTMRGISPRLFFIKNHRHYHDLIATSAMMSKTRAVLDRARRLT